MILTAAGPVFKTEFILDGHYNTSVILLVLLNDFQEILIGRLSVDIGLPVFKYADQENEIIVIRKDRFNILKISHVNFDIPSVMISVRINTASFRRKFHAGNASRLFGKLIRNRSAP